MARFRFIEWLLLWLIETEKFIYDWDSGNLTKSSTKHGVLQSEVEEVFESRMAMPLGIQIEPVHEEKRLGLVGRSGTGRVLMVSFVLRDGKVRPISSRPASRRERESYEKFIREIS